MSSMWATTVYLLCFVSSAGCGLLLVRSYFQNRTALLLWTALCFVLLAASNLLLMLDVIVLPDVDLSMLRSAFALAAVVTLLYGFIWELD